MDSTGQISNVCFAIVLVAFGDRWLPSYDPADPQIALANAPLNLVFYLIN